MCDIGLKAASDSQVWDYAKRHDLIIVSKDSDFHQRSFLYGFPPKVVWIKLGNCSTADVEKALRNNFDVIKDFSEDPDASFLSVS